MHASKKNAQCFAGGTSEGTDECTALPEETCHVLLFVGELDAIALRNAVNSLTEKYSGYCGIFAGDDANGYRFIVGSSSCNCQELATRMRQELQAKGGGSAPMIQGNVGATAEALRKMWETL